MKRQRSEDEYYIEYVALGMGSVHDLADSSASPPTAAILWLPDPEQRRGYREYYVQADKPNERPEPMGFKPNGKGP